MSNLRLTAVTLGVTFVVLHREGEEPAEVARDVLNRGPEGGEFAGASVLQVDSVRNAALLPDRWTGDSLPFLSEDLTEAEAMPERTCAEWIQEFSQQRHPAT